MKLDEYEFNICAYAYVAFRTHINIHKNMHLCNLHDLVYEVGMENKNKNLARIMFLYF